MSIKDKQVTLMESRIRGLTDEDSIYVEEILLGRGNDEVLVEKFNVPFTRSHMVTLRDNAWLNDEVINFYMQMLNQRNELLNEKFPRRLLDGKSDYFMNSFFIFKLIDAEKKYKYLNVQRWTKKIDVFTLNRMFCPVNVKKTHWTLLVVSFQQKRIEYYDSFGKDGMTYLETMLQWLVDEYKAKKKLELDPAEWILIPGSPSSCPQQSNGVDCGVFTIMMADFMADGINPLCFTQEDIPLFRRKICHHILNGELERSYPLLY